MTTAHEIRPGITVRGINVIVLQGGEEVHLDDVTTLERAQAILDDVDAAILAIEDQLAFDTNRNADPAWRARAEMALKKKRRSRPRIQARMGELRRAERQARPLPDATTSPKDGRRKAFVAAAEAMLGHEVFTEIWARAQEMRPAAFEGRAPDEVGPLS